MARTYQQIKEYEKKILELKAEGYTNFFSSRALLQRYKYCEERCARCTSGRHFHNYGSVLRDYLLSVYPTE